MDSRLGGSYASTSDSGAFTDLNRLAQLKGQDRDSPENIKKVAQEFEALFVNQMLKSMRLANQAIADKDSPFSSQTVAQYQEMYDQQLSVHLSRNNGGLGLASVLERQLSKTASGLGRKNPFTEVGDSAAAAMQSGARQAGAAPARRVALHSGSVARIPSSVDHSRSDAPLLNRRRLALPGRLAQRITAGITPAAAASQAATRSSPWHQGMTRARSDDRPAISTTVTATVSAQGIGKTRFASRDDFIATLLPMAEAAARRIGVDPRYLVAQAALETGWGQHMPSNSNNLFGIKAYGWEGLSETAMTREYLNGQPVTEKARFRVYDSYEQSFHDYVSFLQGNSRYQEALNTNGDSGQFMQALQAAGYATDPHYARKVNQIARGMDAYQSIQSLALAGRGTQRI